MKKAKLLVLVLVVVMLLGTLSAAMAADGAPITDFDSKIDLLRDISWADKSQLNGVLENDGMHVTNTLSGTHITLPINITIDATKIQYMYLVIEGFAAGVSWNWALDYTDDKGVTGTINAKEDYFPDGYTGDIATEFHIGGHFNYRVDVEGTALNTSKITFTELRFFSGLEAGQSFVIKNWFLGTLAGEDAGDYTKPSGGGDTTDTTDTTATKAPTAAPTGNVKNGDETPFYFGIFAVAALVVVAAVFAPKMTKKTNR